MVEVAFCSFSPNTKECADDAKYDERKEGATQQLA